jgi:hypothetical protein
MPSLQLTKKVMDFLIKIKENGGKITRQEARGFNFYFLIWFLRDTNLIVENGRNNKDQKIWCLTADGMKVAEHLEGIMATLEEGKRRKGVELSQQN